MKQNSEHYAIIKRNLHRFTYDQATGELLWYIKRGKVVGKREVAGREDSSGYLQICLEKRSVLVHRIIWVMHHGDYPEEVDHINRVRTDNRLCNLRRANINLNPKNHSKRKDNTSGQVGVNFKNGKWVARIQVDKVRIHIGVFKSFDDAKLAYLDYKLKYHSF